MPGYTNPSARRKIRRTVELKDGSTVELTISQHTLLEAYRKVGVVARAAEIAGVHRMTHCHWRANNEGYRQVYEEITADLADDLEQAARTRAIKGVRQVKFTKSGEPLRDPRKHDPETGLVKDEFKDDPWYYENTYSDRLLELLLKAKKPDEFRERQSIEHSGPGGVPMEMELAARQVVITNPELASYLCTALENALNEQRRTDSIESSGVAGSNGDSTGIRLDDQPGAVPAGPALELHQSETGGSGQWSDQAADVVLSPETRQEPALLEELPGMVSQDLPKPPSDAGELRSDVRSELGPKGS